MAATFPTGMVISEYMNSVAESAHSVINTEELARAVRDYGIHERTRNYQRRSGRTTAAILQAIGYALGHPGNHVYFVDSHGDMSMRGTEECKFVIYQILDRLGLHGFDIEIEHMDITHPNFPRHFYPESVPRNFCAIRIVYNLDEENRYGNY